MNKVQKIRNEVERLQNELIQEREKGYGSDVDDACILELQNVLTFIDSLQEEPVSEELEEAAIMYAKEEYNHKNPATLPDRCIGCYTPLMYAFKDGAKWQKEQMLEKAFNGYVIEDIEEGEGDFLLSTEYLPKSIGLKDQQKVKVIVIKED